MLRPGKVLLVGDPKQSIYRFRGADISLWDRTKRLFPDGVERLGQNFRTIPPLLEWVNRVFGVVIAEGREGVQPPYEALAPFRPDVRDAPAVVVVGSCVPEARAIELREQEAEDLARLIVTMKVESWPVSDDRADDGWRTTRFDDVAILVPTRTPLRQLERALDRHDVPYRIESRSLVWATEAVREVLSILTAIDDPGDGVAVRGRAAFTRFRLLRRRPARVEARRRPVEPPERAARGDRGRPSGGSGHGRAGSLSRRAWRRARSTRWSNGSSESASSSSSRSSSAGRATTGGGCASSSTRRGRSWKPAARRWATSCRGRSSRLTRTQP